MDFIISNAEGIEIDLLKERQYIDMDCGGENDFEIQISRKLYKSLGITEGWRIGVQGKEYGGIIDTIKNNSSSNNVTLSGMTWRGLLTKKIIEPPAGEDYRIASGDVNTIINDIICADFDGIFVCNELSGINVKNYHFDRYVDDLAGIEKMLATKNARIEIAYDSGEPGGASFVLLSAVPITDWSDEIEYSKDGTLSFLSFEFEQYTGGINHLICLGKGELKDRLVIHLYVQEDGSIGTKQYYTGKDERTSTFIYSNTEDEAELTEQGTERLKELMSYTNMDMTLRNQSMSGMQDAEDIAIGDIVGGRDFDTGIYLCKQITRKIVQVKNGKESIDYSVGENTVSRTTSTAPSETSDGSAGLWKTDIVDNLDSDAADKVLSAKQGKVLDEKIASKSGTDHTHDLSAMINTLSKGTSAPLDNDYYVAQYAGGGTKTTTYHRRPVSALWSYIKSKLASVATSGSYKDLSNAPTDYVVAKGTSGIWNYRKWNSGFAECWGSVSVSITGSSSMMATNNASVQKSFPFSFTNTPVVSCSSSRQSNYNHIVGNVILTASILQEVAIHAVGATSDTFSGTLNFKVVGKWK